MSDIDGAIGMACYAAFALQQPLGLDELEAAAQHAGLPMAGGVGADLSLVGERETARPEHQVLDPERTAALLAVAPELADPT